MKVIEMRVIVDSVEHFILKEGHLAVIAMVMCELLVCGDDVYLIFVSVISSIAGLSSVDNGNSII